MLMTVNSPGLARKWKLNLHKTESLNVELLLGNKNFPPLILFYPIPQILWNFFSVINKYFLRSVSLKYLHSLVWQVLARSLGPALKLHPWPLSVGLPDPLCSCALSSPWIPTPSAHRLIVTFSQPFFVWNRLSLLDDIPPLILLLR